MPKYLNNMKRKKRLLLGGLSLSFLGLMSFAYINGTGGNSVLGSSNPATFEQNPPVPLEFRVQKLRTPLANGSNMILRIRYEDPGYTLPSELDIYQSSGSMTAFHDDGIAPDIVSGDRIYSAYITENINAFVGRVTNLESTLTSKGQYIQFYGHLGEMVTNIPHFNITAFNNFVETPLSAGLLNGTNCDHDLLKQNSLFITDLSVVEDKARTYNLKTGQGNKYGVWTFGTLMKNIAHTTAPNGNRDFLKAWVKQWTVPQLVNGETVAPRTDVFSFLIEPWLQKANNSASIHPDSSNWETYWNATNEDSLLVYAPFRLMAIVNRQDLRGNSGYAKSLNNAGETRFIFTLVAPDGMGATPKGFPIKHADQDVTFPDQGLGFVDWEGMNVIFEYKNVQNNPAAVKAFAQRWANLSDYPLPANPANPNTQLNDSLEQITNTVTVNGYATLGRIRTNEKLFYRTDHTVNSWALSDWELRQFELNTSGGANRLEMKPMTNTPVGTANAMLLTGMTNLNLNGAPTGLFIGDQQQSDSLINWAFTALIKQTVYHGTHSIPATYASGMPFLAGSAHITAEYVHYLNLMWGTVVPNYSYTNLSTVDNPVEKQMRRQLSLNTCQGCHAGETKTMFTQMRPLGYGESAKYWETAPDSLTAKRKMDLRGGIVPENLGRTGDSINPEVRTYAPPYDGSSYFVKLSAFLTGRNYTGPLGQGTFADDSTSAADDATDATMDGLYYVNDPSNDLWFGTMPKNMNHKFGYNDLQMRKQMLCLLLADLGNASATLGIMTAITNIPVAENGH